MKSSTLLLVACFLAAWVGIAHANSAPAAPQPLPPVVTVSGSFNENTAFTVLSRSCFASGNFSLPAGSVSATLTPVNISSTRAWQSTVILAVFTNEEWANLQRNSTTTQTTRINSAAFKVTVPASAASGARFTNLNVVNKVALTSWTAVILSPSSISLPAFDFTVTFSQNEVAAKSALPAVCPAPAGGHHASKLSVALVGAFGGVVWLSTVFLVVKNTCSQQFFSFANFMATIPQQPTAGSSGDEEASGGAGQAPSSNKPSRKLRLDPKRKQLEDLRQATAAVATITSFKAMPPRFAASLGAFIIVVVSGVWISLLLATLEVENWPSWVGAGITVVIIVVSMLWCYVRSKMGAQNNQEMVEQLQREFAYAVERSREEMAEETQMEMGHGHH